MIKSIKVMLKPNNKQKTKLFLYANTARFAYNWTIAKQQENFQNGGKFINDSILRKQFTQMKKLDEFNWLNNVSNNVTKQAIKDACDAYKRFFKGLSKYPKFKSKKKSIPSFYQDNVKIKFTKTHVKVEGFASSKKSNKQKINWIRLAEKGRIPFGENVKYMNPRFTFDGLNWWVSVGIETDSDYSPSKTEGIGIDLGIKDLAVCSDGKVYGNINKTKRIRQLEKKKRRLQRKISRKYEKGREGNRYRKTNNIIKSEKKLLKVSRRLTNIRHNYIHQITSEIVNRKPMFIVLEDLNVKGMMKNKHLAESVQQQCFHEFRRQIEYKSNWNNIRFILTDRWFPSSKLCSCCGKVKKDLKLSDRTFECECGNIVDRDYQASINLKKYGENVLESAS
ncbi:transposase [Caldibacillus thermoamylovorans]|uniref:RNA-guided endonuclease InsQ/TnpB family protein n=2 Tax=Caldibacillus thermoamylovorans TaxID=35841 RepID=UPI00203E2676|nr:transposase [Caldibacillus thermoamylovorans]MCM3054775.1 transposase [Caldibacillus thermoamylovorans]